MTTRKDAPDALGEPGSLALAAEEPFFLAGDVAVDPRITLNCCLLARRGDDGARAVGASDAAADVGFAWWGRAAMVPARQPGIEVPVIDNNLGQFLQRR